MLCNPPMVRFSIVFSVPFFFGKSDREKSAGTLSTIFKKTKILSLGSLIIREFDNFALN